MNAIGNNFLKFSSENSFDCFTKGGKTSRAIFAKTGTEEKVALREDEAAQKPVGGEMTEEEGALSAGAAEILARPECKEIKIIYY